MAALAALFSRHVCVLGTFPFLFFCSGDKTESRGACQKPTAPLLQLCTNSAKEKKKKSNVCTRAREQRVFQKKKLNPQKRWAQSRVEENCSVKLDLSATSAVHSTLPRRQYKREPGNDLARLD